MDAATYKPNLTFLGLLVGGIIVFVLVLALLRGGTPSSNLTFIGPYDLKESAAALRGSDFGTIAQSTQYLTSSAATFQGFVYLDTLTKTGEHSPCGTDPSKPSCDSGAYQTCTCESAQTCRSCEHEGYRTLFTLYDIYTFEILSVPDASRQAKVSSQLTVLTTQNTPSGKSLFKETISLSALPLQKWTLITVAHEGRRIDVYYNDLIVASATLENLPATMSLNGSYVNAGDSGLTGTFGCLRFYTHALTGPEVANVYAGLVDTRGFPTELDTAKAQASAAVSKATPGGLFNRVSGGAFRMPTLTFQPLPGEKPLQLGSISSLYAVESPYG
jgi:hypothetical protein